ncbi:hypothetical protein D3C87_1877390 [compost metagenome]
MRQQEGLGKIDHHEVAVGRMRNHVHAMRQDEGQRVARKRTFDVADVLHGIATEVDLDLEILVAMRAGFGAPSLFVADVKVRQFAALLHDVSGYSTG